MPTTEAQKIASKKYYQANKEKARELNKRWREENRERYNELCLKHYHKKSLPKSIERLENLIKHKQDLIATYTHSRSPDSPITTDDESI